MNGCLKITGGRFRRIYPLALHRLHNAIIYIKWNKIDLIPGSQPFKAPVPQFSTQIAPKDPLILCSYYLRQTVLFVSSLSPLFAQNCRVKEKNSVQ